MLCWCLYELAWFVVNDYLLLCALYVYLTFGIDLYHHIVSTLQPASTSLYFCLRSVASSGKDRRALSKSSGDSSAILGNNNSQMQTLTQRKGVLAPPQLKVAFFLIDEPIPYSVTVNESELTLAKFKDLVTKKGNYRYVNVYCLLLCLSLCDQSFSILT